MDKIQPQVERDFNLSLIPRAALAWQNQPMVSRAGSAIKAALARLGKTQSWLAEEACVSNNAVSKWIKQGKIASANAPIVARILGIPVDSILPDAGAPPSGPATNVPDQAQQVPAEAPEKLDARHEGEAPLSPSSDARGAESTAQSTPHADLTDEEIRFAVALRGLSETLRERFLMLGQELIAASGREESPPDGPLQLVVSEDDGPINLPRNARLITSEGKNNRRVRERRSHKDRRSGGK